MRRIGRMQDRLQRTLDVRRVEALAAHRKKGSCSCIRYIRVIRSDPPFLMRSRRAGCAQHQLRAGAGATDRRGGRGDYTPRTRRGPGQAAARRRRRCSPQALLLGVVGGEERCASAVNLDTESSTPRPRRSPALSASVCCRPRKRHCGCETTSGSIGLPRSSPFRTSEPPSFSGSRRTAPAARPLPCRRTSPSRGGTARCCCTGGTPRTRGACAGRRRE